MENIDEKKTVLIVDDDDFMLDMYKIKFEEHGFNVDTNSDPVKALDKLRDGLHPIAILFDVIMPKMDGIEFIKTVKNERLAEDAVLIAVSNQLEESYIEKVKELGADDYIIKANTIPSEVLSRVEEVMRKHNKI